ncbi:MAG TPA: hypothetical protein VFT22_24405 [Kofleriaceae bacterium]|nr:hypothetical protein [Kofleriaceae bacterium]
MADPTPIEQPDPGAPIGRGHIDPELVKLARPRPRVGIITAAGLVLLCLVFLVRLGPDRRFAGESSQPTPATVADVLAGKVETDALIIVGAEPLVSQAIRTSNAKGSLGLRVVPVRGTADRLWIAASGDGWDAAAVNGYTGRLRKLDDVAFGPVTRRYAAEHPRLAFATAAAVRAGAATGNVTTVSGDAVSLTDGDRVAADLALPTEATIVASFNDRLPDAAAWRAALDKAGLAPSATLSTDAALGQARFTVPASAETTTTRLEAAGLWAARVEPVTRHDETTWGALRKSSPAGLDLGGAAVPDAQVDLVGLYAIHRIPQDAYVLVTGEQPDDYWYVMPITIALAAILLVFAWALVRAIRRDLLPARAA